MILNMYLDVYQYTNAQTSEGRVYKTFQLVESSIPCNLQPNDSYLDRYMYGVDSTSDTFLLFTSISNSSKIEKGYYVSINNVTYEVQKKLDTYSTHVEFLLKEEVSPPDGS